METKHTPGPWHVPKDIPGPRVFGPDKWMVADCCGIIRRSTEEEKANANLIAAAPDMLAALKCCIAVLAEPAALFPEHGDEVHAYRTAADAVAKAGGWK